MTQAEFTEMLLDALGIEEKDLSITFTEDNIMIVAKGIDEDVFAEDEDFEDDEDE